jgi:hypothetical protein
LTTTRWVESWVLASLTITAKATTPCSSLCCRDHPPSTRRPCRPSIDARHPSPTSTSCRASVDHLERCANRRCGEFERESFVESRPESFKCCTQFPCTHHTHSPTPMHPHGRHRTPLLPPFSTLRASMHFAQLRVFACYTRIQLTLFPATLGLLWPYCHLVCAISLS